MKTSLRANLHGHKIKKGTLYTVGGLILALVLLAVVVFFALKSSKIAEPLALKIGDRTVSRAQFNTYLELGKKTGASDSLVKNEVINYEKNRAMVDKYKINLSDTYVSLSRADFIADASSKYGQYQKIVDATDELTKLRMYNVAFNGRLIESTNDGYGIIVYEFPSLISLRANKEGLVKQAHTQADQMRERIASKELTPEAALDLTTTQNAQSGQAVKSGYYFIRKDDGAVVSQFGGGINTGLLEPSFITKYLSDKQPGLTTVQDNEQKSAFFTDILYVQKKDTGLPDKVEKDKTMIRVVDYDN